jgi:hypothetical protein
MVLDLCWGLLDSNPVVIPSEVIAELTSLEAQLPILGEIRDWVRLQKEVGDRAEYFSWMLERSRAISPQSIVWVSRETDSLGWDIEDQSFVPPRRIEVKGSRGSRVRFHLTEKELKAALDDSTSYEVQFWGDIDLNVPVTASYLRLREIGYPICFEGFARNLEDNRWAVRATEWALELLDG